MATFFIEKLLNKSSFSGWDWRSMGVWILYIFSSCLMNCWIYPHVHLLPLIIIDLFLVFCFYRLVEAFLLIDEAPEKGRGWRILARNVVLMLLLAYGLVEIFFPGIGMRMEKPGTEATFYKFLQQVLIGLFRFSTYAFLYVYMKRDVRKAKELLEMEQLNSMEAQEKTDYLLRWLSSQIYPHFLRNSFSVLLLKAIQLKDAVLEQTVRCLNSVMGYAMETSHSETLLVTQEREMSYLKEMFQLIGIHFGSEEVVKWRHRGRYLGRLIPQFTLLTLIENALKYGWISREYPLLVESEVLENSFSFSCTNRKKGEVSNTEGGLGLANLQRRCEMLLKVPFSLQIDDEANYFTVRLTIDYAG